MKKALTNLAKRKMKKKAGKAAKSVFIAVVSKVGIPVLVGILLFTIFVLGVASQAEKNIVALESVIEKDKDDISNPKDLGKGKATYVGVDDRDTDHSRAVLAQTSKWSNRKNPYFNGYRNMCEGFCNDIYRKAGLPYNGACCAYRHSVNSATKEGKIPKGAIVYSGYKRDGTFYENGHAPGTFCTGCHSWAGHVGIYVGDGIIVGSQIPYAMSVDAWIDLCGYGGWSLR